MTNQFIWTDLSTFNLGEAKRFYTTCLNWRYDDLGGYVGANADQTPSAGLYTMPQKFQDIKMPSFWMSYIQVDDIEATVAAAEAAGGKVEVRPEPAFDGSMVALIRDPAGAGFTCFQGDDLGGRTANEHLGRVVANELHVSSLALVESFYTGVFGWEIRPTDLADRFEILCHGKVIAGIQTGENEAKRDYQYWGVYFAVESLSAVRERIAEAGGEVVAEQALDGRPALLCMDSQGAAFYVTRTDAASASSNVGQAGMQTGEQSSVLGSTPSSFKWKASLGLSAVVAALAMNAYWVWGLLFLLWVIPDIVSGSTYFFELVERQGNPLTYWLIVATWLGLSAYMFLDLVW